MACHQQSALVYHHAVHVGSPSIATMIRTLLIPEAEDILLLLMVMVPAPPVPTVECCRRVVVGENRAVCRKDTARGRAMEAERARGAAISGDSCSSRRI